MAVIVSLVFTVTNLVPHRQPPPAPVDVLSRTQQCRSDLRNAIADKITPEIWERISGICYNEVRNEADLTDFNIRRSVLIEQQTEGRIILWMVVAITLSGVALAGLQLVAAYRLASAGHGDFASAQEVTLEQNKISLKSSVTGLMILVISFAFFMVYVAYVYTVKELKAAPAASGSESSTSTGGYGPPPGGTVQPQSEATTPAIPATPSAQ
ncbi:MAG TPA: hypothetical protein VGO37_15600 [Steroidobacteraceae bacterium]|nr:hypothetical protein [Steroidobacteraceae bacterium]